MRQVASSPLDHLELWRDTKDPWQFLQAALAWCAWEADRSAPVYLPVRMDQTTSGPGILAALQRDRRMALACNMTGEEPQDLYLVILARVKEELARLSFQGDEREQRYAPMLLEIVGRGQVKTACMAAPYGARVLGVKDDLVAWLTQQQGSASFAERVLRPASLLTKVIWDEAKAVNKNGLALRTWINKLATEIVKTGKPVQWTSPSGLLVSCGERGNRLSTIRTQISGTWHVATLAEACSNAPISAMAVRKSITANLIHSFDAATVHRVASSCGALGIPLLSTHDCFATTPSRASELHQLLLDVTGSTYEQDHLSRVVEEMARRGEVRLPKGLPMVGDLDPFTIGSNPYLYC